MGILTDHPQRMKTAALIGVVLIVVGLIDNSFLTWIFLGGILLAALQEAFALFKVGDTLYGYISVTAVWIFASFYPHPLDLIALALLAYGALLAYHRTIETRAFLPLLYPTIGMIFVWMLYQDQGMISLLWLLLVVAATDTGAYYTGRYIGKTPFSPTSPNKTLEGVIGGVLGGTIGGMIVAIGWMDIGFFSALLVSLIGSKMSVFGDLFESYLKREAGVKDSGTILPGHGGMLDRIDGYLFAAPTLYILLKLFGY